MLNLHWNKIKFKGGLRIAEVLEVNTKVKVLDLSWNLLGHWTPTAFGRVPVSKILKTLKKPQPSAKEAYSQLSAQETT